MADFFPTLGAAGRNYATFTTAYTPAAVLAITGSADLITGGNNIYFQVWDDADFTENVVFENIPQDDTHKIVFQRAVGSSRPKLTNSSGVTAWVRDSFVSFENIDIETTGDGGAIALQMGNWGQTPVGNRFVNCKAHAVGGMMYGLPFRVSTHSVGSPAYPVVFENTEFYKEISAEFCISLVNSLGGVQTDWYLRFVNCDVLGAENAFFYRQDDATSTYRVEIINTRCFGYFGTNDWVVGTAAGVLDTSGSTGNVVKAVGAMPGLGAVNPMTLTSNPTPGPGDFAIVVNDVLYANMEPQDVPANALIDAGVGPAVNVYVPLLDFNGNPRSGATCEPGPYEIPTAPALDNAGLMLGFNF